MKNIYPWILIIILGVLHLWLVFKPHSNNSLNNNIQDSLQHQIDSLKQSNIILFDLIDTYKTKISTRDTQINQLYIKLQHEKDKNQKLVNSVDYWTDNDIIQFFSNRYNQDTIK